MKRALKLKDLVVQLENIGYIKEEIVELEDNVKQTLYIINYRKKASIKELVLNIDFRHMSKEPSVFFREYNFFKLKNYWINPNNIAFVAETKHENSKLIDLFFSFKDGLQIALELEKGRWEAWKSTRL